MSLNYRLSWLEDEHVFLILDAIGIATEDLADKVENLADTGDYEPEDIEEMQRKKVALNGLFARIAGSHDGPWRDDMLFSVQRKLHRALNVTESYRLQFDGDEDDQTVITDLVTDLMHLARSVDVDWESVEGMASVHFSAEQAGEL